MAKIFINFDVEHAEAYHVLTRARELIEEPKNWRKWPAVEASTWDVHEPIEAIERNEGILDGETIPLVERILKLSLIHI